MCTGLSINLNEHYFGRTLDFEYHFKECVTIVPRNFVFNLRNQFTLKSHYAFIGMATIDNSYPLFYDGTNEKGLSVAGLMFPEAGDYLPPKEGALNLASFEIIPYILSKFETAYEVTKFLKSVNITNEIFTEEYPPSPLHFLIADKSHSFVLEQTKDGTKIYPNPLGILSNSPSFDIQLFNIKNYLHLSSENPKNNLLKDFTVKPYSRGLGALGLPGDFSSMSRFVKTVFLKYNSQKGEDNYQDIQHFFHILDGVTQVKGADLNDKKEPIVTHYSSCTDTKNLVYYYTTYYNREINSISLLNEDLDSDKLSFYPLILKNEIKSQN